MMRINTLFGLRVPVALIHKSGCWGPPLVASLLCYNMIIENTQRLEILMGDYEYLTCLIYQLLLLEYNH